MAVTTTFLKIELQGVTKATQQAGAFTKVLDAASKSADDAARNFGGGFALAASSVSKMADSMTAETAAITQHAIANIDAMNGAITTALKAVETIPRGLSSVMAETNAGISKARGSLESLLASVEDIPKGVNAAINNTRGGIRDTAGGVVNILNRFSEVPENISATVDDVQGGLHDIGEAMEGTGRAVENVVDRISSMLAARGLINGFKFLRGHADMVAAAWVRAQPLITTAAGAIKSFGGNLGAINFTTAAAHIKSMTTAAGPLALNMSAATKAAAAAPIALTAAKVAAAAAAKGFAALGAAAASALATVVHNPIGQVTLALAALTAGTITYFKSVENEMRVYQDLNPEVETAIALYDRLGNEAKAAATATTAVWGAADNEKFKIYIQDLVGLWTKLKTNVNQVLALLFSSDSIWPKLKADAMAAISVIMGTISTAFESVLPKSLQKVLGINTQFWIDLRQRSEKEADEYFKSTQTGQLWAEQWEKAYNKITNSSKAAADQTAENTARISAAAKGPEEATTLEMEALDFGDYDVAAELRADAERARAQKLADDLFAIEAEKAAKIAQLRQMSGDTPEALEAQNALIEQITQQAADREKEIKIQAAQEVGDYKIQLAEQLAALEEQQAQASLASWQQVGDYLQGSAKSSLESLAATGVSALSAWAEGTGDWRQVMFEGFQSLGKNLVQTGITNIINTALSNQAKAAESQYSIPYVGPILAIAAGAAALATTMALKSKIQKPQISYANGGYISAGLVKGGAANLDSVAAALMPGERVLSKKEAAEYDNNKSRPAGSVFNVTINISGQLSTPEKIRDTVRNTLIPEIKRACQQGYSLA